MATMHTNRSGISRRHFIEGMSALTAAALFGVPRVASAADSDKIVIIHTNDVHCKDQASPLDYSESQTNMGYAGVGTLLSEASASAAGNVVLVDSGDFAQGGSTGTLTQGEGLVALMNATGYQYATLGNHDFDYGLDHLKQLIDQANFKFVCCNLTDAQTGELWASHAYYIHEVAGKKIAFLGITTPETLTKANPQLFKDSSGSFVVNFAQDSTGQALYDCVQKYVDEARTVGGADYVIALAHLGQSGITSRWTSTAVCANTSGIDLFLDGHSHEQYVQTDVKNKAGKLVTIVQTGTQLVAASKIVIDVLANTISAELIKPPVKPDVAVAATVQGVEDSIAPIKQKQLGTSSSKLIAHEDDGVTWAVRTHETNLGDYAADAFRARMGVQIGMACGGSLRTEVAMGTVTYGDLIDVTPFGNSMVAVKAKGQTIADALEMGVMKYPSPSGAFFQVSGLTYEIRTDIASTVTIDADGNFVNVAGNRRVQNVKVAGAPLDLNADYTVSSTSYTLCAGGDGLTMWNDAEPISTESVLDVQTLSDYLTNQLEGVIGDDYKNAGGQGRIVFKNGPDPEPSPVPDSGEKGSTSGSSAGSTGLTAATGDAAAGITVAAALAAAAGTVAVGACACASK